MTIKVYPLASPDGKVIPIDIRSPISCGSLAVSNIPMATADYLGDMTEAILEIWADVDCQLGFSSTPVTTETAIYNLRANEVHPRLVYIKDYTYISGISAAAGTVYYNKIDIWDTLGTQHQVETRE